MGNVQVPTLSDTSSPLCITTPVLSKVPRLVLNTTRSPLRSCSSLPVPTCPPKRASSRACTATTTTSGTTTSTTMGTTRSWSSGSSPVSPSTPVVTREWMQISREFERTNGTLTVLVCTTFSTGVVNGRSVNSGASVGSPARPVPTLSPPPPNRLLAPVLPRLNRLLARPPLLQLNLPLRSSRATRTELLSLPNLLLRNLLLPNLHPLRLLLPVSFRVSMTVRHCAMC
jgi:hypothetical protein